MIHMIQPKLLYLNGPPPLQQPLIVLLACRLSHIHPGSHQSSYTAQLQAPQVSQVQARHATLLGIPNNMVQPEGLLCCKLV